MNRIADAFFIIGILILFIEFKTTDYVIVLNLIPYINQNFIFATIKFSKVTVIAMFLIIGAIGKSAQIGFHT